VTEEVFEVKNAEKASDKEIIDAFFASEYAFWRSKVAVYREDGKIYVIHEFATG